MTNDPTQFSPEIKLPDRIAMDAYPSLASQLVDKIESLQKENAKLKEKLDVAMEYLNELKDEYACSWRIGINVNHEVFKND